MTDRSREGDQEAGGGIVPEVPERPVRRRFDAAYKLRILEEADRCVQPGQLGHLRCFTFLDSVVS